jgi:hypothetical protein
MRSRREWSAVEGILVAACALTCIVFFAFGVHDSVRRGFVPRLGFALWWTAPLVMYVRWSAAPWRPLTAIVYVAVVVSLLAQISASDDSNEAISVGLLPVCLCAAAAVVVWVESFFVRTPRSPFTNPHGPD